MFTEGLENKLCPVEAQGGLFPFNTLSGMEHTYPQSLARVIKSSTTVTLERLQCSLKSLL